jgi:hypothetical protein
LITEYRKEEKPKAKSEESFFTFFFRVFSPVPNPNISAVFVPTKILKKKVQREIAQQFRQIEMGHCLL